jgi:hypothetical protein
MLRDAPSAWTLASSRLYYMYLEGTGNLRFALRNLRDEHLKLVVRPLAAGSLRSVRVQGGSPARPQDPRKAHATHGPAHVTPCP